MKNKVISLPLLLVATVLLMFSSCKKTNDNIITDDSFSAEDNSYVSSSLNTSIDEAAEAAGTMGMAGKTDEFRLLCGAKVDYSNVTNGVLVINYTGAQCFGITRTGSISLSLEGYTSGTRWNDAGAILHIDFNNLTVMTRAVVTSGFTINGRHTLTNVTGGIPLMMVFGLNTAPVTYRHTATDFTVTWTDGTEAMWSVNRLRTFSNTDGNGMITTSSDHNEGGVEGAESWGKNRYGNAFVNAIVTPIVSLRSCGWYEPVQGEFTHMAGDRLVSVLFGVGRDGTPVAEGSCGYGYKITYTINGSTKTRIVAYGS